MLIKKRFSWFSIWDIVVKQTGHNSLPTVFVGLNGTDEGPVFVPERDYENRDDLIEKIKNYLEENKEKVKAREKEYRENPSLKPSKVEKNLKLVLSENLFLKRLIAYQLVPSYRLRLARRVL